MQKMKAVYCKAYGPPEIAQLIEVPIPKIGPKQILIKVNNSSVNRTDCGFRSANYFIVRFFSGLTRPRRGILGSEFAGEVVEVGASVSRFKEGDRVFGFDDSKFGGHAEYLLRKDTDPIALLPDSISYAVGGIASEGAHYGLNIIEACHLQEGQEVLINGATGGIGSAVLQLLHAQGLRIWAVAGAPHLEKVKALGAEKVIDYLSEDFTKIDKQFDVIIDAVGKSSFGQCKALLKKKGKYISTELGPGYQNPFLALIGPLSPGKRVLFPIPLINQERIDRIAKHLEKGEFNPLLDRSYPLEEIVSAYRYVESGQKIGNVSIQVHG